MLDIDRQSRVPVYEQIISQFEEQILTGTLSADELIPSVRALSLELSINPNTIQKAYNDLERRRVTYSVPGKGRFVSAEAKKLLSAGRQGHLAKLQELVYELAIGGVTQQQVLETVRNAFGLAENYKNEEKGDRNA